MHIPYRNPPGQVPITNRALHAVGGEGEEVADPQELVERGTGVGVLHPVYFFNNPSCKSS